tara:strand:- start:604 stop:1041 length:438 start_codon:yes stop_codon:yes gene_type:complete
MFKNILLILLIFIAALFLSWLIDLGGFVEMIFLDYKITISISFFIGSLIFLYFIFYLILNSVNKINNLRSNFNHFIFNNPKRLENKLNKEHKNFINNISKILKEVNNKNFSKAAQLEQNIKSNFYSKELKSQILLQINNEIILKS